MTAYLGFSWRYILATGASSSIMTFTVVRHVGISRGVTVSAMPKENEIPKCDSIEDVIRNFGDLQELAAEMDSYRELALSVESRRSELLSEYPDQWIAVSRDGVVAAAGTRDELFDLLAEKRVRPEDVYHDYLDTKPRTLLL